MATTGNVYRKFRNMCKWTDRRLDTDMLIAIVMQHYIYMYIMKHSNDNVCKSTKA